MRNYDNIGTTDFFMNESIAELQLMRSDALIDWNNAWASRFIFTSNLWQGKIAEADYQRTQFNGWLTQIINARLTALEHPEWGWDFDFLGTDISDADQTAPLGKTSTEYHFDLKWRLFPVPGLWPASFWITQKAKP